MTRQIRDEFVQHREGQRIFTARRVVFAFILITLAGFITGWVLWRNT